MSLAGAVPRRRLPAAEHVARLAHGPADVRTVRDLDDAAFPALSPDQQRASPGELEDGVAAGDVYLLERDGQPVAYLHLDRQVPQRIYVSGLAVRPDLQGGGLGRMIIDHFLPVVQDRLPSTAVVTVTSPRNLVMLGLMLSRGFAARWVLRDFFGPGRDRFGCQLRTTFSLPPGRLQLVPTSSLEVVYGLMEQRQYVVRAIVERADGAHFAMSAARPGEFLDCAPPG
jgi:GNAT superfamily N-acetyltransferase